MEPVVVKRISSEELRQALGQVLSDYFGARRVIKKMRRRVCAYSSSATIENLFLELDRGGMLQVVFKDLSPTRQLATARQVRPGFLYEPSREIESYRKILPSLGLGTPIFYGAVHSREEDRYWLFLERVQGPILWQMGRIDSWKQAASWLRNLHSKFDILDHQRNGDLFAHLVQYDEAFFLMWLRRAEEFLSRTQGISSRDGLRRFGRLANRYDLVVRRLLELPRNFVHGEFYPSNVILRGADRNRICPVDWELSALAPGLIDLAMLTSGNWNQDQKKTMIAAYRETMEPSKGELRSSGEMLEAVEFCQLHLCVQLLGWSSDWAPPKQHAGNWLTEALRLADKYGL